MSIPEPVEDKDRASLDGLDEVFDNSVEADEQIDADSDSDGSSSSEAEGEDKLDLNQNEDESDEEQIEVEDSDDSGVIENSQMESSESPEGDDQSSDDSCGTALSKPLVDGEDRVSRADLVNLLEGFVGILKKDGGLNIGSEILRSQVQPEELKFTDVDIEDKTAELEDMRRLVIEAQETIIKLLTDRVDDRAKIATLETELKLLPDLQEQADRAMAVAFKTEEFRTELHKVKYELEKNRIASVRKDMYKGPKGLLTRVQRWLIKAKGRSQLQYKEQVLRDNRKAIETEKK